MEVFTEAWSNACCERLNARSKFKDVAGSWKSPVVLRMKRDHKLGIPEDRFVHLQLLDGECRSARPATAEDREKAEFILSADAAQWKRMLDGDLDPISAVMFGRLKLERGSMMALMPHAAAARELIAAASEVEGRFPSPA